MDANYILNAEGISKRFPGVLALDAVDFSLKKGEVHALVGENGAGKSTLMNILSGVFRPDTGSIFLKREPVTFHNPFDAARKGIGIVFQELSLVQNLSVAENIFANRQKTGKLGFIKLGILYRDTDVMLRIFKEHLDPKILVKHLSIAKQQIIEILKALSHNPEILILDEPTSSLTQQEITALFDNIRILKGNGLTIIYISHHLQEIFEIADRVTVLRDGRLIDTLNVPEANEEKLVSLMVGRTVSHQYVARKFSNDGEPAALRVENLSHKTLFKNVSFEIRKREIVGFSGLIGAGRSEIARTIFGLDRKTDGRIFVEEREINPDSPREAMKNGIAYASENRKLDGLFLDMYLGDNCIAPQLSAFSRRPFGFLDNKKIGGFTDDCIRRFRITVSSHKQKVRTLSGGNQQKVLLSMWLGIKPKVLIVDEPTKGVDVGAKAEIFELLRELADSGVAIMVISSDLLEVLAISDRIIVIKDGSIQCGMPHEEATEENIIAFATGVRYGTSGESIT